MKDQENLFNAMKSISTLQMCEYLLFSGWKEFKTKRSKEVRIFQTKKDEKLFQVSVPMDKALSDYDYVLFQSCKVIAGCENKTVNQKIIELLNPLADIIKIQLANNKIKNGTLLLNDAEAIYENIKKMLMSTAMSLYSESRFCRGKLPSLVQNFINSCRYGQTEVGSYVISVICPFVGERQEKFVQLSLFDDEKEISESITRKITKKLFYNLKDIKKTLDLGEDLDNLIYPKQSINVNFLEAIENLDISEKESSVKIYAKWSPHIKIEKEFESEVTLDNSNYEPIKRKVEMYKEQLHKNETSYIGQIKTLSSEPDAENRNSGIVSIVSIVGGTKKTIKMTLNKEDYQSAINAHKLGKSIKVSCEKGSDGKLKCISYEEID